MSNLAIRPPQTLGAVIRKTLNADRVNAVMRDLEAAVKNDPTLRAVSHTGALAGWSGEETAAYMILCLKARAERAEARVRELHETGLPPIYLVNPGPITS